MLELHKVEILIKIPLMLQFQEIRVVEIIIVLYSSYVKKQEEKYDPNSREKKKLMSELFGVLTIDSTWNTSSSNNNNNNLFESKNNSNSNNSGGLFSGINVTGNINKKNNNNNKLKSSNQSDLLGLDWNDNIIQPQ